MIERRGEHGCQGPAEGQRTNDDTKDALLLELIVCNLKFVLISV